jgi:hypothetical protein
MRASLIKLFFIILASGIFTWLLFEQKIGINLPLTEAFVIFGLIVIMKAHFSRLAWVYGSAWLATALAVVFCNTNFSVWMNIISFVFFCGSLLWMEISHPLISLWLLFLNLYRAQHLQWERFFTFRKEQGRGGKFFRTILISLVIMTFATIFFLFYRYSSEYFSRSIAWFSDWVNWLFCDLTLARVMFFILGFTMVSAFSLRNFIFPHLYKAEQEPSLLQRKRHKMKKPGLRKGLVHERNFGIALLIVLNLLILLQNFLDIKNIWINFVWDGKVLKQFVHEGTYTLIVSIIVSAAIVLYLFRRNQNFYANNKWLRRLAFIWISQNSILAISVAIRNYWYIRFYNLAYLRIGVFIFLILVILGLALVTYKILRKQTGFSIFGKGLQYSVIVLAFFSLFNWDSIIAKFNIAHSQSAYFHRDFMVNMPDKTLAIMLQNEQLFDYSLKTDTLNYYTRENFGWADTNCTYNDLLKFRAEKFENDWKSRSWKSWNYPEQSAFITLKILGNKSK